MRWVSFTVSSGFRSFEFDLPEALLAHLIRVFDDMESAALVVGTVQQLPEEQGVYQLLHRGVVVYVGKTDGEAGLRQRLGRHAWNIQHRRNLDVEHVSLKAIRVYVFTAIDLETKLIRLYGGGGGLAWNKSGFGSNDPGRERDTTKLKADGFDALYPVNLDLPLNLDLHLPMTAADLFNRLRGAVPYGLRAEKRTGNPRKLHRDLDAEVRSVEGDITARHIVRAIVGALPPGWQATLLPGRVILYREQRTYSAGTVIASSG